MRETAIAKLAQRPPRVTVQPNRITIAKQSLADGLGEQLEWGIFFAGFMIGIVAYPALCVLGYFAGLPMAWNLVIAAVVWGAIVLGANIVYLRWTQRPWILDVTGDRCFALHNGDPRKARLVGRTHELEISLSTPNPATLHGASFEHRTGEVALYHLTAGDIVALRHGLAAHFRID